MGQPVTLLEFLCVFYENTADFPEIPQSLTNPKRAASGLGMPRASSSVARTPALEAAPLDLQLSLSQAPPSSAQVAAICRSLCTSYQVAPSWAQAVADLGRHQNPSQGAPEPPHVVASFRPRRHHPLSST